MLTGRAERRRDRKKARDAEKDRRRDAKVEQPRKTGRREKRKAARSARKAERSATKTGRREKRKAERSARKTERSSSKALRHEKRRTARRVRKDAAKARWGRIRDWLFAERSVSKRLFAGVIGVVLVVGVLYWHQVRIDRLEGRGATVDELARHIRDDPDTLSFSLTTSEGGQIVVSVGADGQAFVDGSRLPALADGLTYQLWGATAQARVSLAVLGGSPGVEAFRLPASVGSMAITVEAAGGVVTSTSPSVAFGRVPAAE